MMIKNNNWTIGGRILPFSSDHLISCPRDSSRPSQQHSAREPPQDDVLGDSPNWKSASNDSDTRGEGRIYPFLVINPSPHGAAHTGVMGAPDTAGKPSGSRCAGPGNQQYTGSGQVKPFRVHGMKAHQQQKRCQALF